MTLFRTGQQSKSHPSDPSQIVVRSEKAATSPCHCCGHKFIVQVSLRKGSSTSTRCFQGHKFAMWWDTARCCQACTDSQSSFPLRLAPRLREAGGPRGSSYFSSGPCLSRLKLIAFWINSLFPSCNGAAIITYLSPAPQVFSVAACSPWGLFPFLDTRVFFL